MEMDTFTTFTPYRGLIGGILIGLSSALFLYLNGRIAGISGMVHGLLPPKHPFPWWRLTFLIGLFVGGFVFYIFPLIQFPLRTNFSIYLLLLGGFFVGLGSRMGDGCTSGHGVCGIARLSVRSLAATVTFMVTAILTVYVLRHLGGGGINVQLYCLPYWWTFWCWSHYFQYD